MASPAILAWQAPIANAAKMPAGWTDAAGVVVIGISDRIGASLPVVLEAAGRALGPAEERAMGWTPGSTAQLASLDPVFCLAALYAFWCASIDRGVTPPELEAAPKTALAAVQADPVLSVVYARVLAMAELPEGEVPTFSSVIAAIRPQWRTIFGRDARVSGPTPPEEVASGVVVVGAVAAVAWYLWRRRRRQ